MSAQLFQQYSQFEDGLRKKFHVHALYRSFHKLSKDKFIEYLLQIGFIAQNFVKWYETAKLGMQSESAREVVRNILRDEIPQSGTTHQDDRLYDLNLIGASTEQVRNVKPSVATRKTIERLYELVRFPQEDYDLRVMITLRIAGEVLVAEQYQHIIRYMRVNLGIAGSQSRFYFPHWQHDLKGAKVEGEPGHTDSFDKLLESMITNERELEVAKDVAEKAFEARSGIHDQFVRKPTRVLLQTAGVVVALVLTVFLGTSLYQKMTEPSYYQFLASLPPQARNFYLGLEIKLIERAQNGIDVKNLHRIGTSKYASQVWGDWP
ncbi:MAG: hypothetical protein G01um101472_151 [Parcubacteria group bacterium Gr01-1014_72]|nr:MAG: hypothetical protein G01um101472_151 [Parcubacteria group bacterium Gr01-1014_72]